MNVDMVVVDNAAIMRYIYSFNTMGEKNDD